MIYYIFKLSGSLFFTFLRKNFKLAHLNSALHILPINQYFQNPRN
jgi:hypothetical protein